MSLVALFPSLQDSLSKKAQNKKQSLIRSKREYFSLEKNKRHKISLPTSKESKGEKKEEGISNTAPLSDTKNKTQTKSFNKSFRLKFILPNKKRFGDSQ